MKYYMTVRDNMQQKAPSHCSPPREIPNMVTVIH